MAKANDKSNTTDRVGTEKSDEEIADPRSRKLTLREAWWPLAVAVAWVLLRSQQVVEQLLNRHSRKPITFTTVVVATAVALKAGGQHTIPKFENSDAAFDELRHHLETGEIEIVGTPFVRVGDLEGSSRLEMGNQQTILSSEMSSLVPYNDHGELCLIPRDWHKAHGSSARTHLRGYRSVLVRSAALVGRFREERTQTRGVGEWIAAEAKRMKMAGKIPSDIKITHFAKELERRMKAAAPTNDSIRLVGWRHIKNKLPEWGLWPISSIP